ncbi:MAG: hypothetical protein RL215_2958 [Planctomycetota bacterium]
MAETGNDLGSYSYSAQRYSYFKGCCDVRVGFGEYEWEWEYEYEKQEMAGL